MNSWDTDTFFSNYYNLQSVYFEYGAPYEKVLHPIIQKVDLLDG